MDTSRASRRAVLAGAVLGCLLAASAVLPAPEEPPASQPSGPQASQPAGAEELQRQIEALARKMEEAARRGDLRELQRLNEDATALSRRLMQLYSQPAGPQPGAPGASLAAGALTRTFAVKVKASQRTQRTVPSHDASCGQGSYVAYQHDFGYTAEQKGLLYVDDGFDSYQLVSPSPQATTTGTGLDRSRLAKLTDVTLTGFEAALDTITCRLERLPYRFHEIDRFNSHFNLSVLAMGEGGTAGAASYDFRGVDASAVVRSNVPDELDPTRPIDSLNIAHGSGPEWPFGITDMQQVVKGRSVTRTIKWTDEYQLADLSPSGGSTSTLTLTIAPAEDPRVESLTWRSVNSRLDDNPNAAGGRRIFPGKSTPSDTEDRATVELVAAVTPPVEGTRVYFKVLDVDDPSSDSAPLDANGSAGDDNRGAPRAGTLAAEQATTDANGEAVVRFLVTMQPGDNFRAAATTLQAKLEPLYAEGTELRAFGGEPVPSSEVKASPLLTVWRRLHIEVDSMGPVQSDTVSGKILDFDSDRNKYTLKVDANLGRDSSANLDRVPKGNGRYENGTLTIGGRVIKVIANGNGSIVVPDDAEILDLSRFEAHLSGESGSAMVSGRVIGYGKLSSPGASPPKWRFIKGDVLIESADKTRLAVGTMRLPGTDVLKVTKPTSVTRIMELSSLEATGTLGIAFQLDDDDQLAGPVPPPDTSLVAPSLAPAYVEAVFDAGIADRDVPFRRNISRRDVITITPAGRTYELEKSLKFDARLTEDDPAYWTVYLLGAYQAEEAEDKDPQSETGVLGFAQERLGAALLFQEVFNDFVPYAHRSPAVATAHEVGHLFGGEHDDLALMSDIHSAPDKVAFFATSFSDATLDRIRSIRNP